MAKKKLKQNPYKQMDAEALGELYKFLRDKAELKKFRKTVPKNQILLDDAIRAAEKKLKQGVKKNVKKI